MSLKRDVYTMPDFILSALENENLVEQYQSRPPYQQNDYVGWIARAKRQETTDKRLSQMLAELRNGDKYMGMEYNAKWTHTK